MAPFPVLFIHFLRKYRFILLLIIVIINAMLAFGLRNLKIDNSLQVWFPKGDSSYIRYVDFLDSFGSDEVAITLITDSIHYSNPVRLRNTEQLRAQIENLPGISRSLTITNIPLFPEGEKFLSIQDIAFDSLYSASIQEKIQHWPENRLVSRFIGQDGYSLVIYSWMDTLSQKNNPHENILHSIDSLAKHSIISSNGRIDHGGVNVIYQALNSETLNKGPLMIGLSYLLVFFAIMIFTRRLFWVLIAVCVVTLSNITVFGIMALTGQPVNMISIAIPPLIMVTGIASIVHTALYNPVSDNKKPSKNYTLLSVLILLTLPLFFNAFTTAGGFLSLLTASMKITRLYGIFAAIGVLASILYSYVLIATFVPANMKPSSSGILWIQKYLKSLFLFSITHRKIVIVFSIVLAFASLIGIFLITIDTESFEFLSKKHPVREQSKNIEAQIGYYMPFDFIITYQDRNWKQRDFLLKLNQLQHEIEKDPRFGYTFSIADALFEAYSLYFGYINQERPLLEKISQQQILLFASKIQQSGAFAQLVSSNGKEIRLTVTGPIVSSQTMLHLANEIEKKAKHIFGSSVVIEPSGYLPMYARLTKKLLHDQVMSIAVALAVVIVLIGIFLRSWHALLIALPSNLLPVLAVLGIMGFAGIFIDIATVTISAAIIGIIVDDTIHILFTLKEKTKFQSTLDEIVQQIIERTGEAVVLTSIILCTGFIIVGCSAVKSISITGWLTALAVVIALFVDLLLLPALAYNKIIKPRLKTI